MEKEQILPSDVARALAARRRRITGVCARCGKPLEGLSTRQYCSNKCAAAVYRDRHRAELNERRRELYQRQKQARKE